MQLIRFSARPARWAPALLVVAGVLYAHPALACSFPPPEPHVIDESLEDDEPPGAIDDPSYQVTRGNDVQVEEADGCGQSGTSCDGVARLTFFVTPPSAPEEQDAAPPDEDASAPNEESGTPEDVGYLIEVIDGEPPEGLLPQAAVVAAEDGSITLVWNDGDDDSQEIVSFTVTISAVDAAGNVGEPSSPIHVFDGGSDGGCRTSRGALGSWAPSFGLTLLLLVGGARALRRRRLRNRG